MQFILDDGFEDQVLGFVDLTDGARGQVDYFLAVGHDLRLQLCNALVGPILPYKLTQMPQNVTLCDGPINVADHQFLVVILQLDVTLEFELIAFVQKWILALVQIHLN